MIKAEFRIDIWIHSVSDCLGKNMKPTSIFCLFSFLFVLSSANKSRKTSTLQEVWNDLVLQTSNVARCHSCARNRNLIESTLTEYEMRNMRIEIVKQTILKQLGMVQAPNIDMPFSKIPLPIREGVLMLNQQVHVKKTEQNSDKIIIISSDVKCTANKNMLQISLGLNIPMKLQDIAGVKLWFYTNKYKLTNCEVVINSCGKPNQFNSRIFQNAEMRMTDGWSEMDIGWGLEDNNEMTEKCYNGTIICNENYIFDYEDICQKFISNETSTKPFVLVDIKQDDKINRGKRNVNCTKGATDCCRENLYVSFADIGWGDWIISPNGYNAYYCKGTCANAATISMSATPYHSVIRKLYHQTLTKGTHLDVTPCCTPSDLSPLQLIYVDQNKSLHSKIIPNLTVNTCGCM